MGMGTGFSGGGCGWINFCPRAALYRRAIQLDLTRLPVEFTRSRIQNYDHALIFCSATWFVTDKSNWNEDCSVTVNLTQFSSVNIVLISHGITPLYSSITNTTILLKQPVSDSHCFYFGTGTTVQCELCNSSACKLLSDLILAFRTAFVSGFDSI